MSDDIQKIIETVLNLPLEDRAIIAERILTSLDSRIEPDVEIAWQNEIQKRLSEIDNNEVECISWEEVRNKLRGSEL